MEQAKTILIDESRNIKINARITKLFYWMLITGVVYLAYKAYFYIDKNSTDLEGCAPKHFEKVSALMCFKNADYIKQSLYLTAKKNGITIIPVSKFNPDELIKNSETRFLHIQQCAPKIYFSIYTTRKNDNLWAISSEYGYSIHTIIGCNPQLESDVLFPGQKLLLPNIKGTLHIIQENDTWESIAKRYNTSANDLIEVNSCVSNLIPGEMIFISNKDPDVKIMNSKMREIYEQRDLLILPINNRITSFFGARRNPFTGRYSFHNGIDIAAKLKTPVKASGNGIVLSAGFGSKKAGICISIKHDNGYTTFYAHLNNVYVKPGQRVMRGQVIGKSGATGKVTGPHLHFVVKKNKSHINPLDCVL